MLNQNAGTIKKAIFKNSDNDCLSTLEPPKQDLLFVAFRYIRFQKKAPN